MNTREAFAWRTPLLLAGIGLSAYTSGALVSISLITVPTILSNTTNSSLLTSWRHTLNYGVRTCPPFAILAAAIHATNAYINRNSASDRIRFSIIAAVSTIGIVPFTTLLLRPTNTALFKKEEAARGTTGEVEQSSRELVKKWGKMNFIRSLLPAFGAVIACWAL